MGLSVFLNSTRQFQSIGTAGLIIGAKRGSAVPTLLKSVSTPRMRMHSCLQGALRREAPSLPPSVDH